MIDLASLRLALRDRGRVIRVIVAGHQGSSPREDGASMLIWAEGEGFGQSGTIGGGALEYEAARAARDMLARGDEARLTRHALGPDLGQCCGGSVLLASMLWDAEKLAAVTGHLALRRIDSTTDGAEDPPFAIRRSLARARQGEALARVTLADGWLAEPVQNPAPALWIWGAGHVGRALVAVFAPLPQYELTWIDTARGRFPQTIPEGVTPLWTDLPGRLAEHAPEGAQHLIVTFSHALDLELCHQLLRRQPAGIGLIGSATKWARFRSRLGALGHDVDEISRITCPIGDPGLGKHPQAIAIGVAVQLLKSERESGQAGNSTHEEGRQEWPARNREGGREG